MMRTKSQDEVQQDYLNARLARGLTDGFVAQPRVDHRMGAPTRVLVLTEIDHLVSNGFTQKHARFLSECAAAKQAAHLTTLSFRAAPFLGLWLATCGKRCRLLEWGAAR